MNVQPVSIEIIGGGTGGWCDTCDLALTTRDNIKYTRANVTLTNGQIQFRKIINGTGTYNDKQIGMQKASGFPSATRFINGGTDIIATAGVYNVAVNRQTTVYSFISVVTYN